MDEEVWADVDVDEVSRRRCRPRDDEGLAAPPRPRPALDPAVGIDVDGREKTAADDMVERDARKRKRAFVGERDKRTGVCVTRVKVATGIARSSYKKSFFFCGGGFKRKVTERRNEVPKNSV